MSNETSAAPSIDSLDAYPWEVNLYIAGRMELNNLKNFIIRGNNYAKGKPFTDDELIMKANEWIKWTGTIQFRKGKKAKFIKEKERVND